MNKFPKRYLECEPYSIVEKGFHKDRAMVSESLFSIANEFTGVRGTFEEGISLDTLRGSYFNGIYCYSLEDTPNAYLGIVKRTHFMINSVDWLSLSLFISDMKLDLATAEIEDFKRTLSFKSGEMVRTFIWNVNGQKVRLTFSRFLSMKNTAYGFQRIEMENLSSKPLSISLDFNLNSAVLHWKKDCYYKRHEECEIEEGLYLDCETINSNQKVSCACKISSNKDVNFKYSSKELSNTLSSAFSLNVGERVAFIRKAAFKVDRDGTIPFSQLKRECLQLFIDDSRSYTGFLKDNEDYWERFYQDNDVVIEGDELAQQGIRYSLFQLTSAYHGAEGKDNIGAKGLTGESYSGHAFWDSETYCLPYYLLTDPNSAKDLLLFRYNTLKQAKERAKALDCKGACYPVATLNGEEGCNLWQHASLQFQPSTGVAYAVYHYYNLTHDDDFIKKYGLEMLLEISHFLLTRGQYSPTGEFGFYAVMGPDEFKMMVNNNCYTNFMAKKTFEFTLEMAKSFLTDQIVEKCHLPLDFLAQIKEAADNMYIPYDEESELFEQNDGFFSLPHIDISSIPNEDFPLYSHWSYDRIYRYDMIKQPDVLMFMFLYSSEFTKEQKEKNYLYYEPRCIHESSLSPSIHSVFAAELGRKEEAEKFFGYATRLDLDDYNCNTSEGLHMTSLAASYINIVYGFGGLRTDGRILTLAPTLPSRFTSYSFSFLYNESRVKVIVEKDKFTIEASKPISLQVYENEVEICGKRSFTLR